MVSLALAEESHPCLEDPTDEARSLRDNALWFPEIPETYLHLNEAYFTGIDGPVSEFRPLCYVLFGGSNGAHPQSLKEISVLLQQDCIHAIDFHYDTGRTRRLGCLRHPNSSVYETSTFLIDGAQGEIIEMIEVDHEDVRSSGNYGRPRSFKVSGYFSGSSSIDLSDYTLIPYPELGFRRYSRIEDDSIISELSSIRRSRLPCWNQ